MALELAIALGALLVGLFVALDNLIDRELYGRVDHALQDHARAIAVYLESGPDAGDLGVLRRLMPEYELPGHADFFEVWGADSGTLFRSASSADRPLQHPPAGGKGLRYYDLVLPDGHAGRGLAMPVLARLGGKPTEVTLAVATERTEVDRLERRVHYSLMGGVALALLLAVGIALLAVRRGLAPVLRFGERVARGSSSPPSSPAPMTDAALPRELTPFAAALDDAFARLYATIERERRFSRDVAHELRTPLTEIRASIEAAARRPGDEAARDAAYGTSIAAVERMQRAIDTLLQLTRYEAGQDHPATDPLDAAALARHLLVSLGPDAAARQLRIEDALPSTLWVRSDVGSLERILSNLLRNAIAYAPAGGTIRLGADVTGAGSFLWVGNPAPGLGVDDLRHFGERFWRKTPAGGTAEHAGLGLALARALAASLALELTFELRDGWLTARLGPLPDLSGD